MTVDSEPVRTMSCGCDYGSGEAVSASVVFVRTAEGMENEGFRILSVRESSPPPHRCRSNAVRRFLSGGILSGDAPVAFDVDNGQEDMID